MNDSHGFHEDTFSLYHEEVKLLSLSIIFFVIKKEELSAFLDNSSLSFFSNHAFPSAR